MNMIEKLYQGKIIPSTTKRPDSVKSMELDAEIYEYMKMFERKLAKPDFEELELLFSLVNDRKDLDYQHYFTHGFKLAISLICESMGVLGND